MDRYKVLRQLGDGTYGSVWKAVNRQSGEVVAIKHMKRKFFSWEECLSLREVKSLRKLTHPCIVKLQEVIRENNELFFIFEYLDYNLFQVIKQRQGNPFPEQQIRDWTFQILQGLDYMHGSGFFHRDLKPENVLVHENRVVKIADFGLARELQSEAPYTDYVATRWYRAPEVLFRKADYSAAVDLFALGAIMAELFTLRPLFPGSTELDEIMRIRGVMGSFTPESWPEGDSLLKQMGIGMAYAPAADLHLLLPGASPEAVDLIQSLCQWNPDQRPTASLALAHPFFKDAASLPRPITPLVLRERQNVPPSVLPPPLADKPVLVKKDSKRKLARAAASRSSAAERPLKNGPSLAKEKHKIDYAPMQSSMNTIRVRERQRRLADRSQKPRQTIDRVRGGQPPDLWINAQGVAQNKPSAAGFGQITRGAPIKAGPWAKGSSQPTFSSPSALQCLVGHRKAVPAREASLKASKEGPAGRSAWPARQSGNAESCQLSHLVGSTVLEGKFAPLSASVRRAAAAAAALGKVA